MKFVDVAKVDDIPPGKTRHVEAYGIEIVLANVAGKIYAVSERCGHMNAPLSKGTLYENIITCPLHHATFDVRTGKMITGMVEHPLPNLDKAPKETQEEYRAIGMLAKGIRIHDLQSFPVKVQGDRVLVNVQ
jgi:nitrite reductase/ring-hydroxylating ferredoxin subunit